VCGICGVVYSPKDKLAEERVRRMCAAMIHRGPDAEGLLYQDPRAPGLALGIRRLSIIDLPTGNQPIWNENGDVAVVFNGELYNYRELREQLAGLGHRFKTQSDTEVLVHAWEEWGEDLLPELRGMFAFALVDFRARYATVPILFLARDPLGIKPLYYTQSPDGFRFASEIRALVSHSNEAVKLSQDALTSYLLFGSVSEPVTILEGIFSLPPGHRMLLYVPERRRVPRARPWWDAEQSSASRDIRRPKDFASAAAALRPILEDAVASHLVADVPVGLFLSSGMDSGTVAALASRQRAGIQSFTLSFPGTPWDESELAAAVARHCRTKHQELPLAGSEVLTRIDEALCALDQPTMDGINTYFVSWAARQVGLKVALSGLGGDELFGGYRTFQDARGLERLIRCAWFVPKPVRLALAGLAAPVLKAKLSPDGAQKALAAWIDPDKFPHPYFFMRALFPPAQVAKIAEPRYRASAISADGATLDPTWLGWLERVTAEARKREPLGGVSWLEMRTYMASTLLRDTDSVSMACSLEVRLPLLDTPLAEFVTALPDHARQKPGIQKALLAEAAKDLLPPPVLTQSKRTFTLPWEQWLRGPLQDRVAGSLARPAAPLQPFLRKEGLLPVWHDFLGGRTSWSRPWSLYVLNEWLNQHLPA
jgi:asparagine synthase (glutamine-hydrolysing)